MVARFVMKFKTQRIISIIAVVTMAIVLSFVFVACNKTDGKDPGDKDLIEPPKKELSASEIYSQVNPSVAFVLIENLSGYSSGSGFFIDSNGTLITNYHVIDDGLSGAIQLYDGTVATIDSVIGYDKNLDIAILSTSAKNTSPVKIADSIIQVGETVYAIGYPEAFKLGFSSSTFTSGMVSMHRSIEGYSYIQSTVNITHGNSGGALINKYGEVVGITTSGITYANIDYMNLSIPIQRIDTVSRTANEPLVIVTRRKYPVYATFYSDGTKYTTQTLSYEGRASIPTAPVKAGYTLDGWYADSGFTEKFDFNKKIISDVSIYAKWSAVDENIRNYKLRQTANGYIITDVIDKTVSEVIIPDVIVGIDDGAFSACTKIKTIIGNATNVSTVAKQTKSSSFSVNITSGTSIGNHAFSGCTGLTSVTIGNSVTSIGSSAFFGCSGLTSITIPDCVTSIDNWSFSGCTGLTNVTIPNSVTSIGYMAFYNCSSLASITIPDSVTSIDNWSFSGCTELTSVTIGNGVTSIGMRAFYGCTKLKSVTIGNGVTSIDYEAFKGCTGLTSITIPDSVTSIGKDAFYNTAWYNNQPDGLVYAGKVAYEYKGTMPSNTSIVLKEGTLSITDAAFKGCSGLTSITIGNSVTSIGDSAFENCSGLTNVTIGNSVTSIGYSAFRDCAGLTSVTIGNSVTSIGYRAFGGTAWYNNQPDGLVYAGKVAYEYKGTMPSNTSIVLKEGTLGIAGSAFRGCTGLTSVTIPDSVTSIGYSAFAGCTGLTSITIPKSVTSIGNGAFAGCTGLTSITIPKSVTSIGDSAFENCSGLTSVTISDSVTSIGNSAFNGCSGLTSVTIGNSVTSIGDSAFENCSKLQDIYITDIAAWCNISGLGNLMRFGASNKRLYINNELATSIILPDSVTSIGDYAFYGCTELTSITIPDSVTSIGYMAFIGCTGLTSITIPDSVTRIGDYVFYGCTGLTSIIISDSVTSIGNSAFNGCSGLTSIIIPDSVTRIGYSAFYNCSGLTSIKFNGTIAQWNAISKDDNWKNNVPATEVVCKDGTVSI